MAKNGIIDIKMRMLDIDELLRIQGFPNGYVLKGTKTNQKKFDCNRRTSMKQDSHRMQR